MGTQLNVGSGGNLRDALHVARSLGCDVQNVRRTGEVRVRHPLFARPIRLRANRKDCVRVLSVALRRLVPIRTAVTSRPPRGPGLWA